MLQDQFVIPLGNLNKTIVSSETTAQTIDREGGKAFHIEAIEGDAWVSVSGAAAIDGTKSLIIPEGKDKSFTVSKNDELSILGGGKVVTSFFK